MTIDGLRRAVTDAEIAEYEQEGVVHLPGILDAEWLDLLERGLLEVFYEQWGTQEVQYDATELAGQAAALGAAVLTDERAQAVEKPGRFLTAIGSWTYNDTIRRFALTSPLGAIAGALFRADKVNYYDDQVLVKEPGAREYTAFHTDEPYYHLSGDQVCAIWVSPRPVGADNSPMRYVRGSHRWGSFFRPNTFVSQDATYQGEELAPLPDIEGNEGDYDIVTIPSQPGDVIVHHSNLVHGSKPNYDVTTPRLAGSFRYAGDDVRYKFHPSAPPQPHHRHDLGEGDAIDSDQFPVVWRRDGALVAGSTFGGV
ncbi:MAG: phytanoyl-CoA dioxygenase family protein [Actinomycetota bacterium]|nr:phytanoyl-CoA dioxygenase family protein [Actinomycetota bacterium]